MVEIGKAVKLRAYGGQEIVRLVVDKRNETVYVCTEEEYKKAKLENRDPVSLRKNKTGRWKAEGDPQGSTYLIGHKEEYYDFTR